MNAALYTPKLMDMARESSALRGGRFDGSPAVATRSRRQFGLHDTYERAELIGANFEVRSRLDGGPVVGLAIPLREESR